MNATREWTSPNATSAVENAMRAAVATNAFAEAGHALNRALHADDIARRRAKQRRIKRRARKLRRGWR